MNVYLDTSALVKLFIIEDGSDFVRERTVAASNVFSSTIAYAECRSAFARRQRAGDLDSDQLRSLVEALDDIWPGVMRHSVSDTIARHAGRLAEQHTLRGYDAVHLATALAFAAEFDDLEFLGFDHRLNEAARSASLTLFGKDADAMID